MKQKDHKALAVYLLKRAGKDPGWSKRRHRWLFLLGSIGPDYLPFTYLHGFCQSRAMLGHNTPYSKKRICKSIKQLQRKARLGYREYWMLGTLMHYLADSFTFAHTKGFEGGMREHRAYEKKLHEPFVRYLSDLCAWEVNIPESLTDFLQYGRNEYEQEAPSLERDCRSIIVSCTGVFLSLAFK